MAAVWVGALWRDMGVATDGLVRHLPVNDMGEQREWMKLTGTVRKEGRGDTESPLPLFSKTITRKTHLWSHHWGVTEAGRASGVFSCLWCSGFPKSLKNLC